MIQGTLYLSYSHFFLRCISLSHLPSAGRSAPASQSQTGPAQNNAVRGEMLIQCLMFFFSLILLPFHLQLLCCYYFVKMQPIPQKTKPTFAAEQERVYLESLIIQHCVFLSKLSCQKKKLFYGLFPSWKLDLSARYPSAYLAAPPAGQEAEGRHRTAPPNCQDFPEVEEPRMSSSLIRTLGSLSSLIAGTGSQ